VGEWFENIDRPPKLLDFLGLETAASGGFAAGRPVVLEIAEVKQRRWRVSGLVL